MTDIERMAGLPPLPDPDMGHQKAPDDCEWETSYSADAVLEYAGLVRAHALEDAAKVCESREQAWLAEAGRHAEDGNLTLRDRIARQAYGNGEAAAAIRALATQAAAAQSPQAAP